MDIELIENQKCNVYFTLFADPDNPADATQFEVYGAAQNHSKNEVFTVEPTGADGQFKVVIPGLYVHKCCPWRYQIFVRNKETGNEWLATYGKIKVNDRYATVTSDKIALPEYECQYVLSNGNLVYTEQYSGVEIPSVNYDGILRTISEHTENADTHVSAADREAWNRTSGNFKVVTEWNEARPIILEDRTAYRPLLATNELSNLWLEPPTPMPETFVATLEFSSGETATRYRGTGITWSGDDVVNGVFVPQANTRYSCVFYYTGDSFCGEVSAERYLSTHVSDTTKHITEDERTKWNAAAENAGGSSEPMSNQWLVIKLDGDLSSMILEEQGCIGTKLFYFKAIEGTNSMVVLCGYEQMTLDEVKSAFNEMSNWAGAPIDIFCIPMSSFRP